MIKPTGLVQILSNIDRKLFEWLGFVDLFNEARPKDDMEGQIFIVICFYSL